MRELERINNEIEHLNEEIKQLHHNRIIIRSDETSSAIFLSMKELSINFINNFCINNELDYDSKNEEILILQTEIM